MKYISLLLLFTLGSCQDYNSNSGDRGKYGNIAIDQNDLQFVAARKVIQNRCVSCHDNYHDRWASLSSSADFVAEGIVVPNDPSNSNLIKRTVNTGETVSNMPPGGSPLPNDEYNTLVDWVTGIQP